MHDVDRRALLAELADDFDGARDVVGEDDEQFTFARVRERVVDGGGGFFQVFDRNVGVDAA